ncbi:MAG: hypothetical protein AAGC65_05605 [Mucilaginibacter sp.]|uniref:hypothetical protein n=1 Tax=Mucilaginibacter sp. TaxID=1882438 RepID=UPI0031AA3DAF
MKKIMLICAALTLFGFTTTKAQAVLDKIDRASDKVDKAGNTVDKAGNTADKTKSTGDKILGFFGKKKKDSSQTTETKTIIKISGVTFSALSGINEDVKKDKNVTGTKMKFNSAGSSILVEHTGTTDDLLKVLQKASPNVFGEKNIESLEDGEIAVKVK